MRALIFIMIIQLLCIAPIQAGEGMGRLFFTPEQRADLDRLRAANKQHAITTEPIMPSLERAMKAPDETTARGKRQGYVKRHDDQKSTVWINGQAIQKESNRDALD